MLYRNIIKEAVRRLLLLGSQAVTRTLAGAGVSVGTLAVDRKTAAMAQSSVAANVHETLDVGADVTTEITFNLMLAFKLFADFVHFVRIEVVDVALPADASIVTNLRKSDIHAFAAGKLNASYSCHSCTPT